MCSTPQKQPAATVAFCEPSGVAVPEPSGPNRIGAEEKGRIRRERNEGMAAIAMRMIRIENRVRMLTDVGEETPSSYIDQF